MNVLVNIIANYDKTAKHSLTMAFRFNNASTCKYAQIPGKLKNIIFQLQDSKIN